MRQVKVFSGNSHPALTAAICERLGDAPAACEVTKFSNGETSVSIGTSVRNQDIYIVQSGSKRMNDSVMEILIMISACKGGSAKSITGQSCGLQEPKQLSFASYFPYCRSSKKKSHRGAITARMVANLLTVAGIDHVITVDLHAPPMQGFFGKPVDNLTAEPIIARWIRNNVPNWQNAVIVSKSAGGSKRITSMADYLKVNFAIITTDRRRYHEVSNMASSTMLNKLVETGPVQEVLQTPLAERPAAVAATATAQNSPFGGKGLTTPPRHSRGPSGSGNTVSFPPQRIDIPRSSPLQRWVNAETPTSDPTSPRPRLSRSVTAPSPGMSDPEFDEYTDEKAREIVTGRLVQGHIVDDDFPSPMLSTMTGSVGNLAGEQIGPSALEDRDLMTQSFMSTASSMHPDVTRAGSLMDEEEDEENLNDPEFEHTITLVGRVNGQSVILLDDILDRSESWIAAAETVVKKGGATKVYCMATHGLFGGNSLAALEACDCIDEIIVCDTFPIDPEARRLSKKLTVLPMAGLLAEAIRKNQHGESLSELYRYYQE